MYTKWYKSCIDMLETAFYTKINTRILIPVQMKMRISLRFQNSVNFPEMKFNTRNSSLSSPICIFLEFPQCMHSLHQKSNKCIRNLGMASVDESNQFSNANLRNYILRSWMKISLKSFQNQTFPVVAQKVSSGDINFIFDAGGRCYMLRLYNFPAVCSYFARKRKCRIFSQEKTPAPN